MGRNFTNRFVHGEFMGDDNISGVGRIREGKSVYLVQDNVFALNRARVVLQAARMKCEKSCECRVAENASWSQNTEYYYSGAGPGRCYSQWLYQLRFLPSERTEVHPTRHTPLLNGCIACPCLRLKTVDKTNGHHALFMYLLLYVSCTTINKFLCKMRIHFHNTKLAPYRCSLSRVLHFHA